MTQDKKGRWKMLFLLALPFLVFLFSISVGRYPVSIGSLAGALRAQISGSEMDTAQLI